MSSLGFTHHVTWHFTNFKAFFLVVLTDFRQLTPVKSWKNHDRVCWMNVYWNKSLYLNCGKNLTVGALSARAGVTDHLAESSVFLVGCSIFVGKTTVYSGCGRQGTSVIESKIIFWSNLFKKVNPTTCFSRGIKIDLRCFCLSTRIKLGKMLLLTRKFNSGK